MKKIERLALTLIILYLLAFFVKSIGNLYLMELVRDEKFGPYTPYITVPMLLVLLFVQIAISIWLFHLSKKENLSTPWVWALFGLFFGVPGAILFFVVRIYENQKITANQNMEPMLKTPVE